jgi:molybdopterin/thiamine biosynthesis adenylyltransferase
LFFFSPKEMSKVFQRQEELKLWNQPVVSDLKCLVLGVGGLGSTISMDLCRLGVKAIVIVDMDIVDEHNLNRQILYGSDHIGLSKTTSALDQLSFHNVRQPEKTIIRNYHFDVLKEWSRTMTFIQECDVIFNTIDWGDYFDYVICKVALKYSKPLVLGGTEPFYGHTISYFLQGTQSSDVTYVDAHDLNPGKLQEIQLLVKNDDSRWDTLSDISSLPKDSHPVIGGSTVYSAGTCSHLMVGAMINYLFHLHDSVNHPNPPKQFLFNLFTMKSESWF